MVILVAPTLDARVRRWELRRWQLRTGIALLVAAVAAAFGAGLASGGDDGAQLERAYDQLTESDAALGAMADTLRALRLAAALSSGAGSAGAPAGVGSLAPAATAPAGASRPPLPVWGRVTSAFARSRRHPILGIWRAHEGLDIAAPSGTPVRAPAAGRVVRVERRFGYGLVVEVSHGRDVVTWYAHLRTARVRVGERVAAGAIVATVGASGLASGPHLHYEVRVRGRRVDPARWSF